MDTAAGAAIAARERQPIPSAAVGHETRQVNWSDRIDVPNDYAVLREGEVAPQFL
jgi:hypothetical protein